MPIKFLNKFGISQITGNPIYFLQRNMPHNFWAEFGHFCHSVSLHVALLYSCALLLPSKPPPPYHHHTKVMLCSAKPNTYILQSMYVLLHLIFRDSKRERISIFSANILHPSFTMQINCIKVKMQYPTISFITNS